MNRRLYGAYGKNLRRGRQSQSRGRLERRLPDVAFQSSQLSSRTPYIRLNVEARGDKVLMEAKRDELLAVIRN